MKHIYSYVIRCDIHLYIFQKIEQFITKLKGETYVTKKYTDEKS